MKKYQVYLIDDGWQKDHPELTFETRADADEYIEYELAKIEADMNTMDCLLQEPPDKETQAKASLRFGYLDGLEYKVVEIDEPETITETKTNTTMKINVELTEDLLQALAQVKAEHDAMDCDDARDITNIYATAWLAGAMFIFNQLNK